MRTPEYSTQFRRDVKRAAKRGKDMVWLTDRMRYFRAIFGWGWAMLIAVWSFISAADVMLSHYGSKDVLARWNAWWHPNWSVKTFVIGLLALVLCMVFERAYRHAKESDKNHSAALSSLQAQLDDLREKFNDERPVIGIETNSVEGPNAWREHPVPVAFSIHHLSGRIATAIHFDPIPSLSGKFSLHLDAIPHVDQHARGIGYRVYQVGAPSLSAHDLEQLGSGEGEGLRQFLLDSPPELIELHYDLVAHFKDRGEKRTQMFRLTFDRSTFRFLPNTAA